MFRAASNLLTVLAGALLLASCGGAEKKAAAAPPDDAAVSDALADPIMTDPDLTSQNQAHAAVVAAGPVTSALPPIDRSPEAIAAAEDAAKQLVGGPIADAPSPAAADLALLRDALTAAQMAAAARITRDDCLQAIAYTARWAALLARPFEVYPRGAVEEAAGTDAGGCGLRVVHFRTPVAVDDVVAFYHARLRAAGYPVAHGADGADHVLRGRKGAVAYVLYVRPAEDGLTAADIVVAG
jgi:hypothetical protein